MDAVPAGAVPMKPLIDFAGELNPEQLAAVTAPDGPALVLAGAGSGKTRTLTYRVAYLLLERGLAPSSLLLLTFTNKAAREMLDRVVELTGLRYPPSWGGTFHSVGGRILRKHGERIGLEPNYTILDDGDSDGLMTTLIKDTDKAFTRDKDNPKPRVIKDMVSFARNTQRPVEEIVRERYPSRDDLTEKIQAFARLYNERKRAQQVVDYDDLLVLWRDLLRDHSDIRAHYEQQFQQVLVDEYQDTNTLQSEIIDLIAGHHRIMAVGDDAQCIYTWRGADFANIQSFPERHPGTVLHKIVRNYRSTPEILALANDVLAAQPAGSGYEKDLVAAREPGLLPFFVPVMDTRQQAEFVLSRVQGLYDEGFALSDIAILYRAHYQALDMQLECSRRGIPFVITSGVKFFDQAHIRDFVAQLRLVSNPAEREAAARLLGLLPRVGPATVSRIFKAADAAWEALKPKGDSVESLFDPEAAPASETSWLAALASEAVSEKVPADAREEFKALVETLRELEHLALGLDATNPDPAPDELVEVALEGWYSGFIRNLYTDWERRQEDLQSLLDFASRYENLPDLLAQLVLLNAETQEKGVELPEDALRMTTVHQAKGLEYPVVFLISCAEDWFPLRRAIEAGDVEEERRLFYVAVTRAKDQLYLSCPLLNSGRGGPLRLQSSRFIRELPEERFELLGYRQPNRTW